MLPKHALAAISIICLLGPAGCDYPPSEPVATLASDSGRPTSAVDDVLITSQVKAALVASQDVNGKDILVTTRQGLVTLLGTVPARQIPLAEEVARDVAGVRDVENRLKPAGIIS